MKLAVAIVITLVVLLYLLYILGHHHPLYCHALGWWYTLRYGAPISGHEFGEPTYRNSTREGVGPVEEEVLRCERCGGESVAWRRM